MDTAAPDAADFVNHPSGSMMGTHLDSQTFSSRYRESSPGLSTCTDGLLDDIDEDHVSVVQSRPLSPASHVPPSSRAQSLIPAAFSSDEESSDNEKGEDDEDKPPAYSQSPLRHHAKRRISMSANSGIDVWDNDDGGQASSEHDLPRTRSRTGKSNQI